MKEAYGRYSKAGRVRETMSTSRSMRAYEECYVNSVWP